MLQSASVHIIRALRWTEGENIHLMRENKNLFPPLSFTSLLIGEKVLMFAFFQGRWDDTWLWIQKWDFFYKYFLSSATGYLWEEAGLNWREQRNSLMELYCCSSESSLRLMKGFCVSSSAKGKLAVLSEWTLKKVVVLLKKFAQSTVRGLLLKYFLELPIFCLLRGLDSVWHDKNLRANSTVTTFQDGDKEEISNQ